MRNIDVVFEWSIPEDDLHFMVETRYYIVVTLRTYESPVLIMP